MSRAISCLKLVHSELKPPRRQTNSMEAGNVRVNPGSSQESSRLCAVFFVFKLMIGRRPLPGTSLVKILSGSLARHHDACQAPGAP